jgi:hypothetical protein
MITLKDEVLEEERLNLLYKIGICADDLETKTLILEKEKDEKEKQIVIEVIEELKIKIDLYEKFLFIIDGY